MDSQKRAEPVNCEVTTANFVSNRLDEPKHYMSSRFLLLPYELRHQIYKASLTANHPIDPHNKRQVSFSPSLLATCKQIQGEAVPVLYGENEFIFQNLQLDIGWLDDIRPHNVSVLRRVQFFVDVSPIIMTEFGGVVSGGDERCLRLLVRQLATDARGLRYLRVHWAGMDEKDYECFECDEDGYGMQPRYGLGYDRRFMLELGRFRGLRELVLAGEFEMSWIGHLKKQMGDEVKIRRVDGGDSG
ncbi:hypothetical protein ACJ72_01018 [Emergomyces africanus]|uniref:Uncharacterized protein n=1 Tax=Emergomyces africanus TaxID=1955775 RepID=A0A1B7P6G9_9EURO|nr:hypothetical protein ACJ72_01018 [Emergomyces africanus]